MDGHGPRMGSSCGPQEALCALCCDAGFTNTKRHGTRRGKREKGREGGWLCACELGAATEHHISTGLVSYVVLSAREKYSWFLSVLYAICDVRVHRQIN